MIAVDKYWKGVNIKEGRELCHVIHGVLTKSNGTVEAENQRKVPAGDIC